MTAYFILLHLFPIGSPCSSVSPRLWNCVSWSQIRQCLSLVFGWNSDCQCQIVGLWNILFCNATGGTWRGWYTWFSGPRSKIWLCIRWKGTFGIVSFIYLLIRLLQWWVLWCQNESSAKALKLLLGWQSFAVKDNLLWAPDHETSKATTKEHPCLSHLLWNMYWSDLNCSHKTFFLPDLTVGFRMKPWK